MVVVFWCCVEVVVRAVVISMTMARRRAIAWRDATTTTATAATTTATTTIRHSLGSLHGRRTVSWLDLGERRDGSGVVWCKAGGSTGWTERGGRGEQRERERERRRARGRGRAEGERWLKKVGFGRNSDRYSFGLCYGLPDARRFKQSFTGWHKA